jgi:hypothetical protein
MVGEIIDMVLSIGMIALAIGQIGLWLAIRKR